MSAALKIKQPNVARQAGEKARFKVVRGPDAGAVYVITGDRATIGRGEENDVILSDLKSSRRHAELLFTPAGWQIKDLGSSNGFAHNGKIVKFAPIHTKDTIELGETILEFVDAEAGTRVLASPAATPEQVHGEQQGFKSQRAKVIAISQFGGLAKNVPRVEELTRVAGAAPAPKPAVRGAGNQNDPKKLLLVVAVLGVGAYLMMGDEGTKSPARKKPVDEKNDLSKYLPGETSPQVSKAAEVFFKEGFREYTVGNYLRAKSQFETVLQIAPDHRLARLYLHNSEQKIDEEVRNHLDVGRKDFLGGKLKEARGHFQAVLRLLYRDPKNPAVLEAKDQLEKLNKAEAEGDQ